MVLDTVRKSLIGCNGHKSILKSLRFSRLKTGFFGFPPKTNKQGSTENGE